MRIRPYQSSDIDELKRITIDGFEGIAIDQNVEKALGILSGNDWRWRKARHVDEDIQANPTGVFVAEELGKVLGYISQRKLPKKKKTFCSPRGGFCGALCAR